MIRLLKWFFEHRPLWDITNCHGLVMRYDARMEPLARHQALVFLSQWGRP